MRLTLVLAAAVALAACGRDTEYESGGALDTASDTSAPLSIPDIDIGMTTDTLNVPTFGMERDTVVVDRPVVTGRKPVEVARPKVDVSPRP